jgi:hypothetical protein
MTKLAYVTLCCSFLCVVSGTASAQYSKDATTATMEASSLFVAHSNFCDSTEAFVTVGPGTSLGFCIEKNLRNSGATSEYEVARRYCVEANKRLPEPMEFKDACNNASFFSLNNIPGSSGEWISNFTTLFGDQTGTSQKYAVIVPVGIHNCKTSDIGVASAGYVSGQNNVPSVRQFRCVR